MEDTVRTCICEVQATHNRKRRCILTWAAAAGIAGIILAVALTAAVVARGYRNSASDYEVPLETKERLYKEIVERKLPDPLHWKRQASPDYVNATTQPTSATSTQPRPAPTTLIMTDTDLSCVSSEDSGVPAAHIKGSGTKFRPSSGQDGESPLYKTRWECYDKRSGKAYVDGGMWFNQTDKALYVPKCGYYYVSSQVYFQVNEARTRSVFHQLNIRRSCATHSSAPNQDVTLRGFASTGAQQPPSSTFSLSSTYVSDIVKLCRGSKIWVSIPDNPDSMPCCPNGQETRLQAFLVSETDCAWPPAISLTTNLL